MHFNENKCSRLRRERCNNNNTATIKNDLFDADEKKKKKNNTLKIEIAKRTKAHNANIGEEVLNLNDGYAIEQIFHWNYCECYIS